MKHHVLKVVLFSALFLRSHIVDAQASPNNKVSIPDTKSAYEYIKSSDPAMRSDALLFFFQAL